MLQKEALSCDWPHNIFRREQYAKKKYQQIIKAEPGRHNMRHRHDARVYKCESEIEYLNWHNKVGIPNAISK